MKNILLIAILTLFAACSHTENSSGRIIASETKISASSIAIKELSVKVDSLINDVSSNKAPDYQAYRRSYREINEMLTTIESMMSNSAEDKSKLEIINELFSSIYTLQKTHRITDSFSLEDASSVKSFMAQLLQD